MKLFIKIRAWHEYNIRFMTKNLTYYILIENNLCI